MAHVVGLNLLLKKSLLAAQLALLLTTAFLLQLLAIVRHRPNEVWLLKAVGSGVVIIKLNTLLHYTVLIVGRFIGTSCLNLACLAASRLNAHPDLFGR